MTRRNTTTIVADTTITPAAAAEAFLSAEASLAAGAAEVAALVNAGMAYNLNDWAGVPARATRTSKYVNPDLIALNNSMIISFVRETNPRKEGTRGHRFFSRYAVGLTVGQLLASAKADKVGDAPAHIRWDLSRGAIRAA